MQYHQITSEERYAIAALRGEGCSTSAIAPASARSPRRSPGSWRAQRSPPRWCLPGLMGRSSGLRRGDLGHAETLSSVAPSWPQVEELLRRTGARSRSRAGYEGSELRISHETIYRHVWQDKFEGGDLYGCLRQATKLRRKRHDSYDRRGRLAGKRHSRSDRPPWRRVRPWATGRSTRSGRRRGRDCVVTLVERKTGYPMSGSSRIACRRDGDPVYTADPPPRGSLPTITSDNGTEFHGYAEVEKATDVLFYFATPYHSWERGTNENFNGLIRQYLPKRKSQAHLTQSACDALAHN